MSFRVKTNESTFIVIMGWSVDVKGVGSLIGWNARLNKGGLEIREKQGYVEPTGVVTDYPSFFTIKHPDGDGLCYTNIEANGIKLKFYFYNSIHGNLLYQLFVDNID